MKKERIDLKMTYWVLSITSMLVGLVFIIWPNAIVDSLCYIVGAIAVLLGLFEIWSFRRAKKTGVILMSEPFISALCLIGGIVCIIFPHKLANLLPLVLSIYIIVDSVLRMVKSFRLISAKAKGARVQLIAAIISAGAGILMIVKPSFIRDWIFIYTGIALLFSSVADSFALAFLKSHERETEAAAADDGSQDIE